MTVDVCFLPALYDAYRNDEAIVVVADVFRATSTIVAAFENGVKSVKPVASIAEAQRFKEEGWLVGAERNVARCEFADFGNSPFDYTADKVAGKEVVFTTTNGTQALMAAVEAWKVITGAFVNLQAVADFCIEENRDVLVLCAGWEGKINKEDTLFGGVLAEILIESGYRLNGDAAKIALNMWNDSKYDIADYLADSEHVERLFRHHLERDFKYCLTMNSSANVPVFVKEDQNLVVF
jgi:2-phosphosulfolactate phosphatase